LRQIIDTQGAHGAGIQRILISGGAGSHDLVRQILADTTGVSVVTTEAEEPVLLGSAMLGALAGGHFANVLGAMSAMSRAKESFAPATGKVRDLHIAGFEAFEILQQAARAIQRAKP
jgi:D-ribulokinase